MLNITKFIVFCYFLLIVSFSHGDSFDAIKQQIEEKIAIKKQVEKVSIKLIEANNLANDSDFKLVNLDLKYPFNFTADLKINNIHHYALRGSYYEYLKAPAASNRILKGQVIDNANIEDKFVLKKHINKNILVKKQNIIGKIAGQNLQQGDLFTVKNTKKNNVISRGDLISLKIQRNNLEIDTKATALTSGSIGENIKVKINDSGKVIVAKVFDSTSAQIQKSVK